MKTTRRRTSLAGVKSTILKVAVALFGASFVGASCGQTALGILPGVVNDPKNLTLRREILAYGTKRLCDEMQRRSVPIRFSDAEPATGRFFPSRCQAQELANHNLMVQFSGTGYAWTNVTKRVAFETGGAIEYDQDFLMDGSTMYVYFRQKSMPVPMTVNLTMVENGAVQAAAGILGVNTGALAANVVNRVAQAGFTVLRDSDGAVDFGLGIVEKGQRPRRPYEMPKSGRLVVANDRSEVHQNQRDFAGPFEVTGDGQAIYMTVAVDGAPAVDVEVVPRALGEQWLQQYRTQPGTTPPPSRPLLDEPAGAGAPWRRLLRVPEGQYYVVFDNTPTAGMTMPAQTGLDDRAAMVSYAIEVGSAP
jgi:hypothetical protein